MSISARGAGVVFAYLFVGVTGASILAWLLQGNVPVSYEKLLSRGVLLFCALGLVPLWRFAGLSSESIGLRPMRLAVLPRAFSVGLLLILPLMLFFVVIRFRFLDPRVDMLSIALLGSVAALLVSATLVGVFEEVLFRGVMFEALCKAGRPMVASIWVGVMYAAVHFLGQGKIIPEAGDVAWYTGYFHVGAALTGLEDPLRWWDSFVSLALLGGLLCVVRIRFGLWWCIGLHSAWVFAIRVYKEVTVRDIFSSYIGWVGEYDHFIGVGVILWLLFGVVVWLLAGLHLRSIGLGSRP